MTELPKFQTEFLNEYLEMVENTESPRLFHIWAAIGGLSATLGRRVQLPFGPYHMFANQYILVVGTPGTRKSSGISVVKEILMKATNVRFAPKDTSGHRQGLAKAMQNLADNQEDLEGLKEMFEERPATPGLADLMGDSFKPTKEEESAFDKISVHDADRHTLAVVGGEFSQFVGQSQIQMLDFLTQMWDGEAYDYQTKAGHLRLDDPLLNIISCTTPSSISTSMPQAAGGQGFLSRVILVHGAHKYKSIPRPPDFPPHLVSKVEARFAKAQLLEGLVSETPDARKYCDELYAYEIELEDPRFVYYKERRQSHLIKTAMALMAARGTTQIIREDYMEAHALLTATERGMPDALGEFGLSPLAALKQGILELCRSLNAPLPMAGLVSKFHREGRNKDIVEAIEDLAKADLLMLKKAKDNKVFVTAIHKRNDKIDQDMVDILSEG